MSMGFFFSGLLIVNYLFIFLCGRNFLKQQNLSGFKIVIWLFFLGLTWTISSVATYYLKTLILTPINFSSLSALVFILLLLILLALLSKFLSLPMLNKQADFLTILVMLNSLILALLFLNNSWISTYFEAIMYSIMAISALSLAIILAYVMQAHSTLSNIPRSWRGSPVALLTAALLLFALYVIF